MDLDLIEVRRKSVDAINIISEYTRLKEEYFEILKAYKASSSQEILDKIKNNELPEHPTYEDYLEAKSLEEDLKKLKGKINQIIKEL